MMGGKSRKASRTQDTASKYVVPKLMNRMVQSFGMADAIKYRNAMSRGDLKAANAILTAHGIEPWPEGKEKGGKQSWRKL